MRGRVLVICLVAVVLTGLAVKPAQANSLLISPNPNLGQKFSVQGDCSQNGINPAEPNLDLTRATWACSGASSQMLKIFYREGPQECVYIDNFNKDGDTLRAFFVPLNTSDEWLAFTAHLPGGVRLRYGCPGQIMKDSCGNAFSLPDMPASDEAEDVIKITTPGGYNGEFSCPMTLDDGNLRSTVGGCGAWKAVRENGKCGPAVMSDVSNPLPGANVPEGVDAPTTILPTTPISTPAGTPPQGL